MALSDGKKPIYRQEGKSELVDPVQIGDNGAQWKLISQHEGDLKLDELYDGRVY